MLQADLFKSRRGPELYFELTITELSQTRVRKRLRQEEKLEEKPEKKITA
jgi:hypothetical protein